MLMDDEGYDRWVIAVLCAIYDTCGFSTSCHIPPEAITSKFSKDLRGFAKKAIKSACRKGLIYRKGGGKSYGLNKIAFELIRKHCKE
jgi:hypothetical protein